MASLFIQGDIINVVKAAIIAKNLSIDHLTILFIGRLYIVIVKIMELESQTTIMLCLRKKIGPLF